MYYKKNHKKNIGLISILMICGLLFITLLLFSWGKSLWQSRKREIAILEFKKENERIIQDNIRLKETLEFLKSPQFKDKWAKERKGKVNPGERVLILPSNKKETLMESLDNLSASEKRIEILKSRPHREQWWEFFFFEENI